jgi:hypothetical protein
LTGPSLVVSGVLFAEFLFDDLAAGVARQRFHDNEFLRMRVARRVGNGVQLELVEEAAPFPRAARRPSRGHDDPRIHRRWWPPGAPRAVGRD